MSPRYGVFALTRFERSESMIRVMGLGQRYPRFLLSVRSQREALRLAAAVRRVFECPTWIGDVDADAYVMPPEKAKVPA